MITNKWKGVCLKSKLSENKHNQKKDDNENEVDIKKMDEDCMGLVTTVFCSLNELII